MDICPISNGIAIFNEIDTEYSRMMKELINVASHTRKKFKNHFLSSVHSEIRLKDVSVSQILEKKAELIEAMTEQGFSDSQDLVEGRFTFEANLEPTLSHEALPSGLMFISSSAQKELRLESDKIVYSDLSYAGYSEYLEAFSSTVNSILTIIAGGNNTSVTKITLKKVNSVNIAPVTSFREALRIFNQALFSIPRSGLLKLSLFQVHEEVSVLHKTDEKLAVLKSKLQKSDSDTLQATLDIDFVRLIPPTPVGEAIKYLDQLNQDHFDLFMWAVTDELRQIMES